MKLSEKDCRGFQMWLVEQLSPYAVPILLAPDLSVNPEELASGSGCLIQFGGAPCLLTCLHVWERLFTSKKSGAMIVAFGDGHPVHLKNPKLIASDAEMDIAVIDLAGIGRLEQKAWFQLSGVSVRVPARGDILVVLGFPSIWRNSAKNQSTFKFGPIPLVVGDFSERTIALAEQPNSEVFEYLDSQPQQTGAHDSCGGLSGAPAFFISPKREVKLGGVVYRRAAGFLQVARATLVLNLLRESVIGRR